MNNLILDPIKKSYKNIRSIFCMFLMLNLTSACALDANTSSTGNVVRQSESPSKPYEMVLNKKLAVSGHPDKLYPLRDGNYLIFGTGLSGKEDWGITKIDTNGKILWQAQQPENLENSKYSCAVASAKKVLFETSDGELLFAGRRIILDRHPELLIGSEPASRLPRYITQPCLVKLNQQGQFTLKTLPAPFLESSLGDVINKVLQLGDNFIVNSGVSVRLTKQKGYYGLGGTQYPSLFKLTSSGDLVWEKDDRYQPERKIGRVLEMLPASEAGFFWTVEYMGLIKVGDALKPIPNFKLTALENGAYEPDPPELQKATHFRYEAVLRNANGDEVKRVDLTEKMGEDMIPDADRESFISNRLVIHQTKQGENILSIIYPTRDADESDYQFYQRMRAGTPNGIGYKHLAYRWDKDFNWIGQQSTELPDGIRAQIPDLNGGFHLYGQTLGKEDGKSQHIYLSLQGKLLHKSEFTDAGFLFKGLRARYPLARDINNAVLSADGKELSFVHKTVESLYWVKLKRP